MKELFDHKRECCSCATCAAPRTRDKSAPVICAVSFTIYRRGKGKGTLTACPRIRICDECLTKALAPSSFGQSRAARKLMDAIREALSARYSAILEADEMEVYNPEVWKKLHASLPFPSSRSQE